MIPLVVGASAQQAQDRLRAKNMWLPGRPTSDTVSGSGRPTSVVASGGSAHTVGSWQQLVASTVEDIGWVWIQHGSNTNTSGANSSTLLNLGVDTTGGTTYDTVFGNLGFGYWEAVAAFSTMGWFVPLFIPRGSRIAFNVQSVTASKAVRAIFEFSPPTFGVRPSNKLIDICSVAASSRGAMLTAPGSADTKSTWAALGSPTTEPLCGVAVAVQGGEDTVQVISDNVIDIAIGATGAEQVVIPDLYIRSSAGEGMSQIGRTVFPVDAPAGTQFWGRYASGTLGSSFDVTLHGIRPAG